MKSCSCSSSEYMFGIEDEDEKEDEEDLGEKAKGPVRRRLHLRSALARTGPETPRQTLFFCCQTRPHVSVAWCFRKSRSQPRPHFHSHRLSAGLWARTRSRTYAILPTFGSWPPECRLRPCTGQFLGISGPISGTKGQKNVPATACSACFQPG